MSNESLPAVLQRRRFGQTDLLVPPVAVGCAPLGNMVDTFAYAVSEEDAIETIVAAVASPLSPVPSSSHLRWRGSLDSAVLPRGSSSSSSQ